MNQKNNVWRRIYSALVDAISLDKHAEIDIDSYDYGSVESLDETTFKMVGPEEFVFIGDMAKSAAKHHGKSVSLNKPRHIAKGEPGYGRKDYVVYVGAGAGKVKRIMFGDPKLGQRPRNPAARKSFFARHKCALKKDRTTPGYWACHHPPHW